MGQVSHEPAKHCRAKYIKLLWVRFTALAYSLPPADPPRDLIQNALAAIASDLIQRSGGGFFMPQYLAEVETAVEREKPAPANVFAMHLAPAPWPDVVNALAAAVR